MRVTGCVFRGRVLAGLAAAAMLSACALDPIDDKSLAKQTAGTVGFSTPAPEPAPFVRESRRSGGTEYLPVGVTPPARPVTAQNADAVKSIEAEMDARRNASAARARSARPVGSFDDLKPPKVPPPPAELVAQ